MTKEQITLSNINHRKAWNYFVSIGIIPKNAKPYTYALHHIDPSWQHNDIERYIQWNIEDLEVMDYGEHTRLHHKGVPKKKYVMSEERKRSISKAKMGHKVDEVTRNKISQTLKGRGPAMDIIQKGAKSAAKANLGKHYYNNGLVCIKAYQCPDGFVPGMLRRVV